MRNYKNIDRYLNELLGDIYDSPSDPKHTEWSRWIFDHWISKLIGIQTILDVGCGDGFCQPMAAEYGLVWTGITLGSEYKDCKDKGLNVINSDFTFLTDISDESHDLVFARHVLEHSAMPLLTLMEWHRVSKQFLCVVLPNPDYWTVDGLNHYSVMYKNQIMRLFKRSGWRMIWENITEQEYRFVCEKVLPDKF